MIINLSVDLDEMENKPESFQVVNNTRFLSLSNKYADTLH